MMKFAHACLFCLLSMFAIAQSDSMLKQHANFSDGIGQIQYPSGWEFRSGIGIMAFILLSPPEGSGDSFRQNINLFIDSAAHMQDVNLNQFVDSNLVYVQTNCQQFELTARTAINV